MAKQRGLGKGLASLIPSEAIEEEIINPSPIVEDAPKTTEEDRPRADSVLPIGDLKPNPYQPRRTMDEAMLQNLAESIAAHGIIQPILVRPADGGYQIVAGERRWRAATRAGLQQVPVRILELSDSQAMELALVENLQREDLSPVEIAIGIQELVAKLSLTHEEIAAKLGISRAAVTNKLRLLQLPSEVLAMLESGNISEGHARALIGIPSTEKIIELALLVKEKSISVRQLEELVRNLEAAAKIDSALPRKEIPPSEFQNEIDSLQNKYRLSVKIAGSRKNMGLLIKGLKKWQVQMLLEFIDNNEELFPRE